MVKGDKLSDRWRTPDWLARALGHFDLDPCSGEGSHIQADVTYLLSRGQDGLALGWDVPSGRGMRQAIVFVNPPYSNPGPWCERLAGHGESWVALVKLDPTTRWWARLMSAKTGWAPFRRRIEFEAPAGFEGAACTAKFPSALVWRRNWAMRPELEEVLWC